MPPVEFEPTISAGERPQNYALDRAATGTGIYSYYSFKITHLIVLDNKIRNRQLTNEHSCIK